MRLHNLDFLTPLCRRLIAHMASLHRQSAMMMMMMMMMMVREHVIDAGLIEKTGRHAIEGNAANPKAPGMVSMQGRQQGLR